MCTDSISEPEAHSVKQVRSLKRILPISQMQKMRLREGPGPRSHSRSVVELYQEFLPLVPKAALSPPVWLLTFCGACCSFQGPSDMHSLIQILCAAQYRSVLNKLRTLSSRAFVLSGKAVQLTSRAGTELEFSPLTLHWVQAWFCFYAALFVSSP